MAAPQMPPRKEDWFEGMHQIPRPASERVNIGSRPIIRNSEKIGPITPVKNSVPLNTFDIDPANPKVKMIPLEKQRPIF